MYLFMIILIFTFSVENVSGSYLASTILGCSSGCQGVAMQLALFHPVLVH